MKLADLASQIPVGFLAPATLPDLDIKGVTHDSRKVQPGFLFVAVPGLSSNGNQFIPHAVENGAVAVVGNQDQTSSYAVPYLQVAEPRFALAWIAAALQDFPAKKMNMIGVTGTDGTATFTYRINSRKTGTGTYTVAVTASKAGYTSGSATITFNVQ